MAQDAVLEVFQNDQISRSLKLGMSTITIGRSRGELVIDDPEVSSAHCQIQLINGHYHLFDLNSTNGTYLNGKRILKSQLTAGDKIRVGQTEMFFQLKSRQPVMKAPALSKIDVSSKGLDTEAQVLLGFIKRAKEACLDSLRLVLDVTYPDRSSEKLELRSKQCEIGRTADLGRFDTDEELSRKHALIEINDKGEIEVSDLGSTNGTYVNDEKVLAPRTVTAGDLIRIGNTKIRVSLKY